MFSLVNVWSVPKAKNERLGYEVTAYRASTDKPDVFVHV